MEPLRVLVTGAAGQIAYSLLHSIAKGDVFGKDQRIILHLLDIPPMMGVLEGVVMELIDCAFPLVVDIVATTDEAKAFDNIESAFLVGSMPRREGMERKDLLAANVKIFKSQGMALDKYAKKTVKVLVVGNPANTNAFICSKYAPSIPKENFSAMTRLDQNRAQAQIASRLKISPNEVSNVIIWGNHSSTQFPDASHAEANVGGKKTKVIDVIEESYLKGDFISVVQKRGAAVIAARKLSSAMSAAKAAGDHMRDWWHGTPQGKYVSMAVYSDGSYGVPADVMFSFPVEIGSDRNWKIVQGLSINDFAREKLTLTGEELVAEKTDALSVCEN
ncbi:malate dehydrogenase, cytoplasmic-like [Centruroides sculpturatus]|uniref:malate dehydrogenase, cytoplasmic-like n=1 Tax=Centruroides sculpturatus TaxID=218467 RepID=UPI000C6CDC1D|nr:malate dehydrogenase, cytoplasmic-like [Centruroides sculpturatus]